MKIYRLAMLADEVEDVYYGLKEALKHLDKDNIGKAKTSIKDAIKGMEKIKPHLKDKKHVIPDTFKWRSRKEFME